jgi:hypothetical protein
MGRRTQQEPALADLTHQDMRGQLRTADPGRKDELLGALVRLVQADRGAFGVLAACLLPGLRHRIARHAPSLDREEALALMVDALYEAVASYDAAQHHQFIAEALLALPTRRLRRAVVAHRVWSSQVQHSDDGAPDAAAPVLSPPRAPVVRGRGEGAHRARRPADLRHPHSRSNLA